MKLAHPQGVAPARRYLLSGLLKCSRCGEKLFSAPSHERRTYRCNKGVANRGCGQCFIWSDPIELFICEMLLQRLESPEFQKLLQERGHEDAEVTKAEKTLIFARGRGDEIALMLAQGELSRSQFHTAQGEITRTIESAQKVILNSTQPITIATLGESGEEIRFRFWGLNLDRQRAIVKMVLSHIVIDAESRVAFHPDRVEPHWLL